MSSAVVTRRCARSAYYTNLKPGHYRFRVRANDFSSSTSEATLSFALRPHFYQTGWFYGVAALSRGTLIWGGMALYGRQTRSRYALLINDRLVERSRLAREMLDTVIQGCVGVATLLEAIDGFRRVDAARADRLLDDARCQMTTTLEEARQAFGICGTLAVSIKAMHVRRRNPCCGTIPLRRFTAERHTAEGQFAGENVCGADLSRHVFN